MLWKWLVCKQFFIYNLIWYVLKIKAVTIRSSYMLYFRSLRVVQHDIIFVYTCYVVLLVSSVWSFSTSNLNTVQSPLGYVVCLLNLYFGVLSVICRLHNLRSPFKNPFYLSPPIVFSFSAHAVFYLGTIRRFSWNGTTMSHWRFHYNRRKHKHRRMFLNSKFYLFIFWNVDSA
jgi:hypothetical protein